MNPDNRGHQPAMKVKSNGPFLTFVYETLYSLPKVPEKD